ncbi:MAG: two-component system sensor histidine kinase KdbD [candidate division NC10 bacterium RIFCSPLOWO2_12_FULL_66_18]|nr:MAG: two-component system sensor histidine kinase KdbD [candidate division NC10 bacterium RIFCSPLOWO2_12_FULL_66_18]
MNEGRSDPDALLARVKEEEARRTRGKLNVFLGAAAGVGKTYAMLQAALERRAEGVDVVVGWVDAHGREETEALLEGIEILPRRQIEHRGTVLMEFDLDAALLRRPTLILVDELAHTNTPGSRHAKRWQDVQELLDAGISVYTTVNVQDLESLNDVVAKITGLVVRETVPDSVLEQADEVRLIDLPPEELLQRLKEGKVYVPAQAKEAVHNFFRKGNLIALRELALRRMADRVDAQMRLYMQDHAIAKTWPVTERLMVCVGASPSSTRLVRAAKRMADGLRAEWIVAYVETPAHARLSEEDRVRVTDTLRLAEQLGAETVTLSGHRISEEILAHARTRNVSKIIVGKPAAPLWKRILVGSIVDNLVRGSGDIDIYVTSGEESPNVPYVVPPRPRSTDWMSYARAAGIVALCTAVAWAMFPFFELSNLIMVYLLGVVGVAARSGRGPSVLASVLSVAAFDFFFVPPYFTFAVADAQYLVTFAVMFFVALITSGLTVRIRRQAESARQRERRTAVLYAMSRELASIRGVENILPAAVRHIAEVFRSQVMILLPDAAGRLLQQTGLPTQLNMDATEFGVAQWVYEHRQMAGLGTTTLPGANALYLPLVASRGTLGVLGIRPTEPRSLESPEQLHQLETFANQTALALERAQLAEETQQAQVRAETERLRSSLLSSVSHDLRTPLASITGAASSLLEGDEALDAATRQDLLETVREEADRLNRLVHNLLDMTRLESGALQVNKEWHPLEEVVGAALGRLAKQLQDRPLTIHLPADLPLVPIDDVLIEQLLINLVDNAAKYTPHKSPIEIAAWASDGAVTVEVADRGPGLAPGDEERVFDKFYRGVGGNSRGVGLGLAICRGIAEAHGGRIWSENRADGGVAFRFTIPLTGTPPRVEDTDG